MKTYVTLAQRPGLGRAQNQEEERPGCKQSEGRIWILLISKYLIHCLIPGILQEIRVEREKVALVDKNTFLQTIKKKNKKQKTKPYQKPVSKRNERQEIFYNKTILVFSVD